jgi:dienelactone hydrolase
MKYTRREITLGSLASCLGVRYSLAAEYRDYSRCLPDYITRLADEARTRRDQALAKLVDRTAIEERQVWARTTFQKLIGAFPSKTDLNLQEMGTFNTPEYKVQKLRYESRPNFFVTANFYLPVGSGPFPGVLFQMGHAADGKAYPPYQRACQSLARLGFAVLAFDPIGQGERVYYPKAGTNSTRLPSVDDEHSVPGQQLLLVGKTCSELQLWDAIRSLDVLANHEEVDAKRLASVGQSGGATLSMMLAAVDSRLATIAVMSGNTENFACPGFLPPGSVDDAEQDLVGSGPVGFERFDLLHCLAPKPLLVSVSEKDFFGTYSPNYLTNSRLEFTRLKEIYSALGSPENLRWSSTPLPHGLSYDSRLELYSWLRKHLLGNDQPVIAEPTVNPEPEKKLWATRSGNTVRDWNSKTTLRLAREAVEKPGEKGSLLNRIPVDRFTSPSIQILGKVQSSQGIFISAAEVQSAAEIYSPGWLFEAKTSMSGWPVILLLDQRGRNATWHESEICFALAMEGYTVLSADVRGSGDLRAAYGPGNPAYVGDHQGEEAYAWASLILGKPMLGQRATDILAWHDALSAKYRRPVAIAASGKMTTPAIVAAALEKRCGALYLSGGLPSFASLLEKEEPREPFANWIPNAVPSEDLPGLLQQISPRPVKRGAWSAKEIAVAFSSVA